MRFGLGDGLLPGVTISVVPPNGGTALPGCLQYAPDSTCAMCGAGYTLASGKCTGSAATPCPDGMYIDADGKCWASMPADRLIGETQEQANARQACISSGSTWNLTAGVCAIPSGSNPADNTFFYLGILALAIVWFKS